MKRKLGFKLDWLEMLFVIISVFFAGIFAASTIENNYIYVGLLLLGAGRIILQKKWTINNKSKDL